MLGDWVYLFNRKFCLSCLSLKVSFWVKLIHLNFLFVVYLAQLKCYALFMGVLNFKDDIYYALLNCDCDLIKRKQTY